MEDFPSVCALTYVSASFVSVSRVHAALALAAQARPAMVIEHNVMVNLDFSILIIDMLSGLLHAIVCRLPDPRQQRRIVPSKPRPCPQFVSSRDSPRRSLWFSQFVGSGNSF